MTELLSFGRESVADVCGEGRRITRAHTLQLAQQGGLHEKSAVKVIDHMLMVAPTLAALGKDQPIRSTTLKTIATRVADNAKGLRP
jgi:hypothetical protein